MCIHPVAQSWTRETKNIWISWYTLRTLALWTAHYLCPLIVNSKDCVSNKGIHEDKGHEGLLGRSHRVQQPKTQLKKNTGIKWKIQPDKVGLRPRMQYSKPVSKIHHIKMKGENPQDTLSTNAKKHLTKLNIHWWYKLSASWEWKGNLSADKRHLCKPCESYYTQWWKTEHFRSLIRLGGYAWSHRSYSTWYWKS